MKYLYYLNNCFLFEYILKCNLFLWFQNWIFITQVTWSLEIILIFRFAAKKNIIIIIIIMLKTAE